jgi:hypothetical protein
VVDATTGAPLDVSIDYDRQALDEEKAFALSDFQRL